ncbi:MAG: hypothetical protein HKN20_01695 [Gemmatimonadetes bacterium]|nr:hypothetical protein [Gemmatimonadota bacterium]
MSAGILRAEDRPRAETSALALDAPILAELIRKEHAAPFWLRGEPEFTRVEQELRQYAGSGATADEILTQMLRMIAVVGDGHTMLAGSDRYQQLGIAPFFAEIFDDGVYLVKLPESESALLGAKILAVGGASIESALDRLRAFVPHSNESRFRRWAHSYLHLPGLMHALGLSDSPSSIDLTLRTIDGEVVHESFVRMTLEQYRETNREELAWPETRRDRKAGTNYFYEPIPEDDAVYFNFRRVANADSGETIWAFGARLASHLEENTVDRLVIDLRENGGGGYQYAAHLRPLLASVPSLDRPGGIVILTGPKTFSAASDFLSQMQRFTHATLIGVPPGGSIGEPGDDDDFTLPNTGLTVRISQVAGRDAASVDRRRVVRVDVPVPDRFADRMAGRDAALDAALAFEPAPETLDARALTNAAWAGRYAFEPGSDLVIRERNGFWRATALPQMDTPLAALGPGRARAGIPGLDLVLDERRDGVRLIFADGSEQFCARKASDEPSAWDLVFAGRIAEATPLLREALEQNPDSPSLTDGAFTSEAIHLTFTLSRTMDGRTARLKARELLETSIAIHPGGAPESEFSLRFYPKPE